MFSQALIKKYVHLYEKSIKNYQSIDNVTQTVRLQLCYKESLIKSWHLPALQK